MPLSVKANGAVVRNQVLRCINCSLHEGTTPVPFRGPLPATLTVMGEAPGKDEEAEGKPFVGASGRYLLQMIKHHMKIEPDELFIMNTVSCRPPGNRTPYEREIKACARNVRMQLAISGSRYVLLAGATALRAVRPDVKLTATRGLPFWRDGHIFLPTWHPAAILRQRSYERTFIQDLNYLSDLIERGFEVWPELCVSCDAEVDYYNELGIPYCNTHRA